MTNVEERLKNALEKREEGGNLRRLSTRGAQVDFFSNDYLGLAHNIDLQNIIKEQYDAVKEKSTGATGSRLLSGNSPYYEELEIYLANIFKGETALVFNSGYTANLAIFSSIPQKGDTIIYDELIHACIKEGSRLSFANRFSFRHNDLQDLESKLLKAKGPKFVAIESVYSMDGDFAPVKEVVELCKKYEAWLIVDEAHGTGVFGENGSGWVCNLGLEQHFFIRTYTFGKAIGSHGACVVASKVVIEYLVNFARSFIYTTALPFHNLVSIRSAFDYLSRHGELQRQLQERIKFFRDKINDAKNSNPLFDYIDSKSAIQAILVPGNERAKNLAAKLIENGFDVRPILSPTVQEGKERIRICLHAYNSFGEIEELVKSIQTHTN
ncbi:MAG TPA: 8-amino-7-oxononanoate synthase [Cytophagales bacterium]|nr:8-amino-7-oxononanoate synthase [Cytophagales bacterium]